MYVLDLVAVDKSTGKAGTRGSSVGEMNKIGFPISPGFVLTTDAFERFVKENRLQEKIDFALSSLDVNNPSDLKEKSKYIEGLILSGNIQDDIQKEIISAYDKLSFGAEIKTINERALDIIRTGRDKVFVSVRVSPTNQFPGQTKSFLNVSGSEKILEAVKRCWVSVYSPRALAYSKKKKIEKSVPAIVIQKMVNAEKSGVVYTSHPCTGDKNQIVVEAVWGLGQSISLGLVVPDLYLVEKASGRIIEKKISKKPIQLRRDQIGNTMRERVPEDRVNMQVLNDFEIRKLWEVALRMESEYGPQDIEWCSERAKTFLMQSRSLKLSQQTVEEPTGRMVYHGLAASPGIVKGKLKIVSNIEDLNKIEQSDIVLAKNFPEIYLHFGKFGGILLEDVGLSNDIAITAREFGVPCIIGSGFQLKENDNLEIANGKIYSTETFVKEPPGSDTGKIITGTEIFSHVDSDGCIIRAEQMFSDQGKHPIQVAVSNPDEFVQILTSYIVENAKKFYPKQVWYRSLDVKTNEFQNLETEDPKEENPLLGFRGIRRMLDEDILRYELDALKKAQEQGLTNVCFLLPFVTNTDELQEVKKRIDFSLKIGISCDTPSCALSIDEFCKQKVDCVCINISDLSQLVLGVDKSNPNVSKLYSESDPSVLKLVKDVIQACKKHVIKVGLDGNVDQKLLETAIENGIDFISSPNDIKSSVARIERKILLQKSRERLF